MDYKFTTDLVGRHIAQFTMGHEALGYWLTSELGSNAGRIASVFKAIVRIQNNESWGFELEGQEYALSLSPDEAVIRANGLDYHNDDADYGLEDDLDFYDSESQAQCGLDDFKELLAAWIQFVGAGDT